MSLETPLINEGTAAAPPSPLPSRLVAPVWHTLLFVAVVIGFAGMATQSQGRMVARHGRETMYVLTLAWEWLLTGYVIWGARRRGVTLRELIGGRWNKVEDVLLDAGIAFGFWLVSIAVLAGMTYALGLASAEQLSQAKKQIGELLPQTRLELGLWLALSATAGFCEEVMFRGYLQRQCAALTRSTLIAIVLQGAVFGIGHAYQGGRRIVLIGVYGLLFGILAAWRKSLRPGMIGHALQDSFSGIVFRALK